MMLTEHVRGGSGMVVAEYLTWLRLAGRRPSTIDSRRRLLARVEAAVGPLCEAGGDDWRRWYLRLAPAVTDGTRASYLSAVRSFYSWAVDEGLVAVDPTARLPRPSLPRRLPRPIPEDDLRLALATADDRVRPMLLLAAYTGLRAGEIARLRGEDIVDGRVLVADGKGGRSRTVPLHPVVARCGLPRAGWCFPRRDGQPGPVPAHLVSHLVADHMHALGMPWTCHSLRHRFATRLYRVGHDLRLTQELMGHASPVTTASYAAWAREDAAAAVDLIPA